MKTYIHPITTTVVITNSQMLCASPEVPVGAPSVGVSLETIPQYAIGD
ncbi:MAG: hypothetical protein IJ920_05180 [Paludibacteraceae bacterium]|nr:hypothetical protein [Paludibacteraceae bacterium]